jgi:hypothetical protein
MSLAETANPRAEALRREWRARREPRERALRIVDYASFPRTAADTGTRLGFTRDLSPSGMCIGVDAAEDLGSLLRVTLLDLDGQPARCGTWRVVWCSSERDGRFFLGLELVAESRRQPGP